MKKGTALLMLVPVVAFSLLSYFGPLVMAGRLSLYSTNYIVETFVGFGNYRSALSDSGFTRSLVNAGIYILFVAPIVMLAAFWSAQSLLAFGKRGRAALRIAIYLPGVAAGLAISLVWRWAFSMGGPIDWILGIHVGWFSNPWAARFAVSIAVATASVGFYMIVFLSALLSIPQDVHDAARIDGASEGQIRQHITIPMILPTFALVTLLLALGVSQMWETVYVMSYGGPFGTTATPVFDFWRTAFEYSKHGLAAAKSVLLMVAISTAVALKRRIEAIGT